MADRDISKEFREWWDKIPHVPFDPAWDVRAVPPFAGALIRYRVQYQGAEVSIYLDGYDRLGAVGKPYWEIYPGKDGEPDRFLMNETAELVAGIAASIAAQAPP